MNDAIREVFEELNRPSEPRLKQVLRQRGIPFDAATVKAVVSRSTEKQLQAPALSGQDHGHGTEQSLGHRYDQSDESAQQRV